MDTQGSIQPGYSLRARRVRPGRGSLPTAIDSGHSDVASRARLNLGVLLEQTGEYDLAEEAYQQAVDSGHPEVAPEGMRNLRGLPMRFPEKDPFPSPTESGRRSQ